MTRQWANYIRLTCLSHRKLNVRYFIVRPLFLVALTGSSLFMTSLILNQWLVIYNRQPLEDAVAFIWDRNASVEYSSCDFKTIVNTATRLEDLQELGKCRRVFYNRVPKCASRTVLKIFQHLDSSNPNFNYVGHKRYMSTNYFQDSKDVIRFVGNYTHYAEPLLYSRHMHFVNFSMFGYDNPVYINVIRDPMERVVSHYYFNLYGSDGTVRKKRSSDQFLSLDECVARSETCAKSMTNTVLPFFCGHEPRCRSDKEYILRQAKRTVRERYLVVGLTEDLPNFFQALEILLPHFFSNATKVFDAKEGALKQKTQTTKKLELKPLTKDLLRSRLADEFDFYYFVKQRFYTLLKKLKKFKYNHDIPLKFGRIFDGYSPETTTRKTRETTNRETINRETTKRETIHHETTTRETTTTRSTTETSIRGLSSTQGLRTNGG